MAIVATKRSRTSGIDRILQLLDYLQDCGAPASAYEIAKAINAPISTIYTIVKDLCEKQILVYEDNRNVWLGPRLYHYGLAYAHRLELLNVALQEMESLSAKTDECVQICGRDHDMMVVLGMEDVPGHFKVTSKVGTRVPLNWSASGKLLTGHMPDEERRQFYADYAQESPTGRAVTDPDVLSESSKKVFLDRSAVQIGESDFAVACIAAPIIDQQNECVATISIVLPESRARIKKEEYIVQVQQAARQIEEKLGWNPLDITR